jgi:hypothetical protein
VHDEGNGAGGGGAIPLHSRRSISIISGREICGRGSEDGTTEGDHGALIINESY